MKHVSKFQRISPPPLRDPQWKTEINLLQAERSSELVKNARVPTAPDDDVSVGKAIFMALSAITTLSGSSAAAPSHEAVISRTIDNNKLDFEDICADLVELRVDNLSSEERPQVTSMLRELTDNNASIKESKHGVVVVIESVSLKSVMHLTGGVGSMAVFYSFYLDDRQDRLDDALEPGLLGLGSNPDVRCTSVDDLEEERLISASISLNFNLANERVTEEARGPAQVAALEETLRARLNCLDHWVFQKQRVIDLRKR